MFFSKQYERKVIETCTSITEKPTFAEEPTNMYVLKQADIRFTAQSTLGNLTQINHKIIKTFPYSLFRLVSLSKGLQLKLKEG